ncbi:Protein N-lysine methyltransferase METTL21D [Linum perenne]
MEADRLNSPSTCAVLLEVMGHQLQFTQDPNSKHLGTTVWDASMVLVKYLEKNCRRGRFCPSKLKGKRAIELGAGCGVAGFGMALLGCDVISTDQVEVLPLLMRNVERNTARVVQSDRNSDSFGSISAAELDWGNKDHIRAVEPPFDFIIGTDVVYAEHLLQPLLQTIFALSGPKTIILLGHEIRSTIVHETMLDMWRSNFEVKIIPKAKMHYKYQHPSIQLYMMEMKHTGGSTGAITPQIDQQSSDQTRNPTVEDDEEEEEERFEATEAATENADCSSPDSANQEQQAVKPQPEEGNLTDWETRRVGSMAARLLRDVKIT